VDRESLLQRMRARTASLHEAAERSGIVAALFGGHASQADYALYLRNLLPAYQVMEHALRTRPQYAGLAQPDIFRAESIIADLEDLSGSDWSTTLPLLPSAQKYAARVEWAVTTGMLIAHCYTRYLGDLNGGQLLARRLRHLFGPNFAALRFTEFPDVGSLRAAYRDQLDRVGERLCDPDLVIEESAVAFRLNIELSLEIDESGGIFISGR
jgi:heme oxygenase